MAFWTMDSENTLSFSTRSGQLRTQPRRWFTLSERYSGVRRLLCGQRDASLGDVDQVDLTRSLVEPEQAHIAVEALGHIAGHVAAAAENLHGPICYTAAHLGGEQLAHGRFHRDVGTVVPLACGLEHQCTRRMHLRVALGDHLLHQLELADRLPELAA